MIVARGAGRVTKAHYGALFELHSRCVCLGRGGGGRRYKFVCVYFADLPMELSRLEHAPRDERERQGNSTLRADALYYNDDDVTSTLSNRIKNNLIFCYFYFTFYIKNKNKKICFLSLKKLYDVFKLSQK